MLEHHFIKEDPPRFFQGDHLKAAGALLFTTIPNFLFNIAHIIMIFTDLHTMTNLNDSVKIGGYGIGLTIIHTFCYAIIVAITNGSFTLLSQAYGAQNYTLMGNVFQRAQLILIFYFMIMFPILYFTQFFLVAMGIDSETAGYTQEYVRYSFVAMIFRLFMETTRAYVQSQKVFYISMYASLGVYVTYPLWIQLYVNDYNSQKNVRGLGMTRSTCEVISYIILYAIIQKWYKYDFRQSWFSYNWDGFKEWCSFLRVAVPVGMITFMEFSFWEIQTFIIGTLNFVDQLAAHTSYGTIEVFLFYFPLALSFTINSYLGAMVGGGKLLQAKNFIKFAQFTNLCLYILIFLSMRILRGFFASEFSLEEYRYHFLNVYDIGTIGFILGDCFQITHSAILRVMGLQDFAAVMFVICYYCIGMPLSVILVYSAGLQLYGAWITLVTVSCTVSFIMFCKTQMIDHSKCIENVLKRVAKKDQNGMNMQEMESPLIKEGAKQSVGGENQGLSSRNTAIQSSFLEDKVYEINMTEQGELKKRQTGNQQ